MALKLNIWSWFVEQFETIVGKAISRLTQADGKEGLSIDDIKITAQYMRQAEVNFGTGAERREWVLSQVKNVQKIVLPHLVELVFWTALSFANQKGWVKLGNSTNA